MKKFWMTFWSVIIISFSILGYMGVEIYQQAPPIPNQVVTETGEVIINEGQITKGQNVWQAMGGMEVGSIWGHGSYVAQDWSADWIHREALFILDELATQKYSQKYEELKDSEKAYLREELSSIVRTNTYNSDENKIVISEIRKKAFDNNVAYYSELFTKGDPKSAIPSESVTDPQKLKDLSSFFFWAAWSASTERPNSKVTYTANWPHEPLINNKPSFDLVLWTGVSVIGLLAGISVMAWYIAIRKEEEVDKFPSSNPLAGVNFSLPSQLAVIKYFWVVGLLILVQLALGIITAHYGVEGDGLYGIPLDKYLPYSVARTWHTQIGIFWIATSWLAAGLYLAPVIGGYEPKGQRLGVNVLFGALLLVVAGSLTGEWLSVKNYFTGDLWFYFGHQGYEYVDLGRVWQAALFAGLLIWLFLVGRPIFSAIQKNDENKPLLTLFFISTIAIAGFYSAGLMWGKGTHLAITEYWRWWVVHLWVEGFFEIFATSVIALLFVKMGLIKSNTANKSVVLASAIFLAGGIIGTLHHLYFSGTPTFVLALGSVFSALEVVPLVLVAFEAVGNLHLLQKVEWMQKFKWPVYFFIAVAFWNMAGAGLFGFMINPPIALYYMQGLNTTPVHGHTAFFGVYGMLGLGLMLFCLRCLNLNTEWNQKAMNISFWLTNIGLGTMVLLSLLPIGIIQTITSVNQSYWHARSTELLYSPMMQTLKWLRVPGDIIFALGLFAIVALIFKISLQKPSTQSTNKKEKELERV
jgi:nitric oxide reductase subunit B